MILLNENTHTYHENGHQYADSVTGIIKKAGYIDDRWFTEYGRLRGKLTHLALKFFNDRVLDEDSLDPAIEPYFRAYVRWLADSGFVVKDSEMMVRNKEWDYAGTLDIIGFFPRSRDILCVGDTKTYGLPDWTRIQLALYVMATGKYLRRFGLELRKNGTYRYKEYSNPLDFLEAAVLLKKLKEGQCT